MAGGTCAYMQRPSKGRRTGFFAVSLPPMAGGTCAYMQRPSKGRRTGFFAVSLPPMATFHSLKSWWDQLLTHSRPNSSKRTLINAYLFPESKLDVSEWLQRMCIIDESEFARRRNRTFVKKLYFVKGQQEFVIADLVQSCFIIPEHTGILMLQREMGNRKITLAASHAADLASEKGLTPMDTVVAHMDCTVRDDIHRQLVYSVEFTDNDHLPSIIDLALAADVACYADAHYMLLKHQAYWWADTLMAIVESQVDEKYHLKLEPPGARRVFDGQLSSREGWASRLRPWKWKRVRVDNRAEITEWKRMFKTEKMKRLRAAQMDAEAVSLKTTRSIRRAQSEM
ncbi:hypothetical protein DXG03_008595 [Asterophora parasitica]|uniref:Uncharacterized protein n=1 Tax=Asterophora parasitica TaxID=117018 RepID=A0A9P7GC76_9AGAR|nr:hypothetical protein DXG03_008595 [Asterophora parasitica]